MSKNYLETIKDLIFFDDEWKFPNSESANEYISSLLEEEIPTDYFELSSTIVDRLNSQKVSPDNFEKEFDKIVNLI